MKKILVTGATGFIGNYVVAELLRRGHNVITTSLSREKAAKASWFDAVDYIPFNLEDFNSETDYYDFFGKPDAVIHLSWEGLPNYKSLFHFETNLPRHYAFLKNLIINGCRDMTIAGTCFEYGNKEGSLTEDIQSAPANPYALAKDCLNKFLTEFAKTNQFVFRWIRLFYLYGKGQHPNSLFSQLDRALDHREASFNMSAGEQVRDYLPVEVASAYMVKIAEQDKVTGIINCCSGVPVKVKDLVNEYLKNRGKQIVLNLGYYSYPDYEPMSFWGDNHKLQKILNEQ